MKSALITGAGRGLGKGFVDYLLSQGYLVFAGVREMQTSENPNLHYIELDVTRDESISNAFNEVNRITNSLEFLINNAGVNKDTATGGQKELVSKLESLSREKLLHMFNTNSVSPLLVTKAFLPLLQENPSFVINVSSCRASFHDPYESSSANYGYAGSKLSLNMFTFKSVRDLPPNVKTFAVHPGNVKTDMNQGGTDDPQAQAQKIIGITKNWVDTKNGSFLNFDGTPYPL